MPQRKRPCILFWYQGILFRYQVKVPKCYCLLNENYTKLRCKVIFLLQQVVKWIKRGLKFSLFLLIFEGDNRLKAFVYKRNITQSIEECENICVEDDCCRSINYWNNPPSGEEKICELLYTVKVYSSDLENKHGYRHYKLNYPDRVRANKKINIILYFEHNYQNTY